MIRQRALAWATVLALVATVQSAPLPARFSASVAALAQDDSAADTGEPTDLAIVALHCAEAPAAEALTTFFASATLPTRCAPAVGVTLTITENGDPVSGSPFTTDVAGTAAVPSLWAPRSKSGKTRSHFRLDMRPSRKRPTASPMPTRCDSTRP
jgi:hypothetical protein